MRLKDRVALITGASRGIGAAIALKLAGEGADIAINYANSACRQEAETVKKQIEAFGRKACIFEANVADFNQAAAMTDAVIGEFGKIDILVNNAGINRDNLLVRMKEEDWDAVLGVNLKGVFNVTKAVVKYMMKQRYGRIISISSVVGVAGNAGQVNYAAAKAGILGLTKSVAKEVAGRNITANAIAPGFIRTAMTANLPEKTVAETLKFIPLGRMGEAEDIAKGVLFFASEEADYVTGQTLHIDGGMLM
ncbi:MAG: 3-oxoacyl-[acyl-carrier-protein] reductase [Phascolarctobacterium sp.]|nr:3-oxoacyl-[acyl-carrier-protein] reductase [Candidatus Phascolarctobacterium caballi]